MVKIQLKNERGNPLEPWQNRHGRVKQRLTTASGDVREPAWGPFIKE